MVGEIVRPGLYYSSVKIFYNLSNQNQKKSRTTTNHASPGILQANQKKALQKRPVPLFPIPQLVWLCNNFFMLPLK